MIPQWPSRVKILNLQAADTPSTIEINRARRVAFKMAHPDMLTGSPEFSSDRMALERCLKEAIHLKGYIETAALTLTLAANAAWEPTKNRVEYPLVSRRPPLDRTRSPTGGGGREPPPTPPTANRSTARADTPSNCHWQRPPPPPPPEPPRARPDHEAARRAAQNEAARVRKEQDARRRRQERYQAEQPRPPPPSMTPSDSMLGWHAIDNLTVIECAVNPNAMLSDVPHACVTAYAHAQVDVLSRIEEAASSGTEDELARALKWFLALDAIILRTPTRGGSCGNNADIVSQRLRLWRAENMTHLIQKWPRDTSTQAWDRRRLLAERSPNAPSESLRVTQALQLIADGEIGRAQAMLLSEGIHNCMDPLVLEQLRSRQPRRTTSMPTTRRDWRAQRVPPSPRDLPR